MNGVLFEAVFALLIPVQRSCPGGCSMERGAGLAICKRSICLCGEEIASRCVGEIMSNARGGLEASEDRVYVRVHFVVWQESWVAEVAMDRWNVTECAYEGLMIDEMASSRGRDC